MNTSYRCFGVTEAVPIPMQGLSFSSSPYFSCILFITFSNLLHCISSFLSLSFGTPLFSLPHLVFHHLIVLSHFSLLSLHFLFSFFQIRASFSHVRNNGFIFRLVLSCMMVFYFFCTKTNQKIRPFCS